VALPSEVVIVTLAAALLTRFQLASTALTMMPPAIAVPTVCAVGVPVLPVGVPGAAISPGNRSCSLVAGAGLTVMIGVEAGRIAGFVTSEAVIVRLPAVLKVTVNEPLPLTRAELDGTAAFASVNEMATVSLVWIR